MKRISFLHCPILAVALAATLPVCGQAQSVAVPQLMNFQGRLANPNGTPVADGNYSVAFTLFDAVTGGAQKWTQTVSSLAVKNGTFAAQLSGFPAGTFNGNLWLEIKIGANPALTPRQQLVSVAYAMKAGSVSDGAITASQISSGTITADKLAPNALNSLSWLLGGNSGTSASQFLGTTDNIPLSLKTNNRLAMRYTYTENTVTSGQEYRSFNIQGGSEVNSISAGVVGATIAGGGIDYFTAADYPNTITVSFGTISGGYNNTVSGSTGVIAGGSFNVASGIYGTVGGGTSNTATNYYTTVAGGISNAAVAYYSSIGGGFGNRTSGYSSVIAGGASNGTGGDYTTVGGGTGNSASGANATVPGGKTNAAAGASSFAAGYRAKANHAGAFVWGDSTEADFTSTGANQFIVRAGGGVGINTTSPQAALHVKGNQGTFNLEGTDHVYMQFYPRGFATGRKGYMGFPSAGSHDLEIANEDTGVLRVRGTFVNSSDRRFKKNIADLSNPLESLLNLRGVSYDWRTEMAGVPKSERRQLGFIAQEVEQIFPDLVYTDEQGYKSVNYIGVIPVLVESVKTQQKQIDSLKAQNDALEAKLNALAQAVSRLQKDRN